MTSQGFVKRDNMDSAWIIDLLDEHGLRSTSDVEGFVAAQPITAIRSIRGGIGRYLRDSSRRKPGSTADIEFADYFASSSLRGDSGCAVWDCRRRKLEFMARYAALYCDHLVVPLQLGHNLPRQSDERRFAASVLSEVVELRPLIKAGVITLIPEGIALCREHAAEADSDISRFQQIADTIAERLSDKFRITYLPSQEHEMAGMLRIEGPEECIEHGSISYLLHEAPAWLPEKWKNSKSKTAFAVPKELVSNAHLVSSLFRGIAQDVLIQTHSASAAGARYATDLSVELELFHKFAAQDPLTGSTAALCARLIHTIPLFEEVSVETALELRAKEPEAFLNYRSALSKILGEYVRAGKAVTEAEARDIYEDRLLPELHNLEAQARAQARSSRRRATRKLATSSVLVAFGVYAGLFSPHMADMVKVAAGFGLVKEMTEAVGELICSPSEIQNHNLYFLLRLKQESRH